MKISKLHGLYKSCAEQNKNSRKNLWILIDRKIIWWFEDAKNHGNL